MRLFVAIDVNNTDGIERIQNHLCKKLNFDPRYVKPTKKDNLHLTINFIGERNEMEAKDVILDLSAMHFTPFKIVFGHVGVFPNTLSPKIIWLGLNEQSSEKLSEVYSHIDLALKKHSERKSKGSQKFVPHLTIFRIRKNYPIPAIPSLLGATVLEEEVDRISLKESNLTPNGPIYSDLFVIHADKKNA